MYISGCRAQCHGNHVSACHPSMSIKSSCMHVKVIWTSIYDEETWNYHMANSTKVKYELTAHYQLCHLQARDSFFYYYPLSISQLLTLIGSGCIWQKVINAQSDASLYDELDRNVVLICLVGEGCLVEIANLSNSHNWSYYKEERTITRMIQAVISRTCG